MGVARLEELVAWQLGRAFKLEVYRLLRQTAAAQADRRYCEQLRGSAASVEANIGEGFHRFGAREFARLLQMALASPGEAEHWLQDGVDRGHFDAVAQQQARVLAKRCRVATARLRRSLDGLATTRRRPSRHRPPH